MGILSIRKDARDKVRIKIGVLDPGQSIGWGHQYEVNSLQFKV